MDYTIVRKNGSGAIIWSEGQKRYIISEYVNNDRTLKSLSEEFHVRPESIRNMLRKENISITSKKNVGYPRNSDYFEEIDSSEKAYWLGMMLSDGNVGKDNSINLSLKDREHIEKFKKAIGAINHKITVVEDNRWEKSCFSYCFSMKDKKMAYDLAQYGCVPNKTYINFNFPQIDNAYIYDFIRGYFDGDGSIYYSKDGRCKLDWAGQKNFLQDLKIVLQKENISLCQNIKSKLTYSLRICGQKDILRILHLMYDGSTEDIRLNRKYEKALYFFSTSALLLNKKECE